MMTIPVARQMLPSDPSPRLELPDLGFCLRCGAEIPCDPERPYCDSHYRSWARFKNESFEEKRCHTCGVDHVSSMAKPLCTVLFQEVRWYAEGGARYLELDR